MILLECMDLCMYIIYMYINIHVLPLPNYSHREINKVAETQSIDGQCTSLFKTHRMPRWKSTKKGIHIVFEAEA